MLVNHVFVRNGSSTLKLDNLVSTPIYIWVRNYIHILYVIHYTHICNHEVRAMSLSSYHHNGYLCTWAYDIRLHTAGTNESKRAQQGVSKERNASSHK